MAPFMRHQTHVLIWRNRQYANSRERTCTCSFKMILTHKQWHGGENKIGWCTCHESYFMRGVRTFLSSEWGPRGYICVAGLALFSSSMKDTGFANCVLCRLCWVWLQSVLPPKPIQIKKKACTKWVNSLGACTNEQMKYGECGWHFGPNRTCMRTFTGIGRMWNVLYVNQTLRATRMQGSVNDLA